MKRPICPKCGKAMTRTGNWHVRPRWVCKGTAGDRTYCYSTTDANVKAVRTRAGKRSAKPLVYKRKLTTQRFIITAAQNATPVHVGFLKSLETACNALSAELLVVPLRYKNPTSRWTASQANEEVWADELQPYLFNQRKKLNSSLVLLGDIKTHPTASQPLTGFEAITHGESGILGHTKLQLRTVPAPQNRLPKILTTTGAVTTANYTDSRAGKVGEFHHTLGAALVEIKGKTFHLRQLNADKVTGIFYDLDKIYSPGGVEAAPSAAALVMGDTHVDFIDPGVKAATFGECGIVKTLRPEHLVFHDILDGYSVNPHHAGNPFTAVAKYRAKMGDVWKEVRRAIEFIEAVTPQDVRAIIVPSNHDDFLRRWIIATDWRGDPENAAFYLETALAMVRGTRFTEHGVDYPSPFSHWVHEEYGDDSMVRCLRRDESFALLGVELGMHGDAGPNGSRGSARNLRRIGVKSIVGHSHSPAIEEGCYQVGTSTRLRLEYNHGPSSWLNTHCVLYANGKRSLISVIDGEFRL